MQYLRQIMDWPPEGSAQKENKLDCFEDKHIFNFNGNTQALFTFYSDLK